MEHTKKPSVESFIMKLTALYRSIKDLLCEQQQLIRFCSLPFPFKHYKEVIDHLHKMTVEPYNSGSHEGTGLRLGTKSIAVAKYLHHDDAKALTSAGSIDTFLKILISVDEDIGLLINVKVFNGPSITVPYGVDMYETQKIQEDRLRDFECIYGLYVNATEINKARQSDPEMKKLYMSFSRFYFDLDALGLVEVFWNALWQANEHIEKNSKIYVYDKA